jgi:phospholipase C
LERGTTKPPYYSAPTGVEVPGPFPCFRFDTIAQRLDEARISWAYYAPEIGVHGDIWSAFDAIWSVRYGADWVRNVRSPETRVLNDIAAGKLPSVAWVVPSAINSDHAGVTARTGPQWVASIVNAIGESPYWKSTIIVVVWDDWGGWYDHVPPPQLADPRTGAYEGLGFRIPMIVISPYAKRGYVSHARHELASTLVRIEKTFGLSSLGGADERADDLSDMLDFAAPPRSYRHIPTAMRASDFLRQPRSTAPPDD